jgi:hypothetical protein
MAPTTSYSKDLADREPLAAMRDNRARLTALTRGWTAADYERTYAPGKWTARQVVTHLAQTELALEGGHYVLGRSSKKPVSRFFWTRFQSKARPFIAT